MPDCFVIMGFGSKTDLATGRVLDLDKTYKNIIKPAVEAAGYDCKRADEIQHSGVIDVPMYEMLYGADLVVADLSTSNLNAAFELGVRHALKPRTTIIIAEDQFKIPFDATHIVVRHYKHLGLDIGFDEAMRMQKELADLARSLRSGNAVDSPVYTVLTDLEKPSRRAAPRQAAGEATGAATAAGGSVQAAPSAADTYAAKLDFARQAMNSNAFALAKTILQGIYQEQTAPGADGKAKPARPGVVQQLVLATYKAGEEEAKTAGPRAALAGYAEAETLLETLEVDTTTDPETLGLWSAIHKRRAEMAERSESERKQDLDKAIRAAERGFLIKRDYYNGTNLAYLLNLRASMSAGDDRIADNVLAKRVRRDVVDISARRLATLQSAVEAVQNASPAEQEAMAHFRPTEKFDLALVARPYEEEKFWVEATHADSLYALGDPSGEGLLKEAIAKAPAGWMADIAQSQHEKLKALLDGMRS
jgi:hypothetical protein